MHEGGLLGTYEIRSETGNAGTGMYRRGADEHGSIYTFIEFPMSLTALPRIKIIRTEAGVLYIYLYFRVYL